MAYRDPEIKPHEFLKWICNVKRIQMWGIGTGPALTVVSGCRGYVVTDQRYLREIVSDVATSLAVRASS